MAEILYNVRLRLKHENVTPPFSEYGYLRFPTGDPDDDWITVGRGRHGYIWPKIFRTTRRSGLPRYGIPRDHCFFSAFPEDSLNGKAVYIDAMKVYRGNGGTASFILNLDTRWRWVASLCPVTVGLERKRPIPIAEEARWAPRLVRNLEQR